MQFSPAVDPRLVSKVARTADLRSAAEVWRSLRRRARHLRATTPCYETVRRLVIVERERRARLIATIATILEIAGRRVPVLPEEVPFIARRRLRQSRRWLGQTANPPP